MIHIKYRVLYSLLCISVLSCAQSKHLVKKVYATYTVHLPGNIMVDKNGNSISRGDTLNVVYVVTLGQIHWARAWKNGRNYSVIQTLITETPFEAGINKMTNEKIILHSTNGNKLWKLQLVPEEKFFLAPLKTLPGEIILHGIYHGKKIIQKILQQTEIASIPSV
jgi:hypothetical protein